MNENKIICSHCGAVIDSDDYEEFCGKIYCTDCLDEVTTYCDCCGSRIYIDDVYGDDYTNLCSYCYHNHYIRCSCCLKNYDFTFMHLLKISWRKLWKNWFQQIKIWTVKYWRRQYFENRLKWYYITFWIWSKRKLWIRQIF